MNLLIVYGIAHTGNGLLGSQTLGQKTAEHIQLVRGGAGNHQIRTRHIRLFLHLCVCTVPHHAGDIQLIDCITQLPLTLIDQSYIVFFIRQLFRQLMAHLSVPDNYDIHVFLPSKPYRNRSTSKCSMVFRQFRI